MINAGRLRHRIIFQTQSQVQDTDTGQRIDTWAEIDTVMAEVIPISGNQFVSKSGEHSEVTTKFKCRYVPSLSGLTSRDRISFNSAFYDIEYVINPRFLNRELQIMCKVSQSGD